MRMMWATGLVVGVVAAWPHAAQAQSAEEASGRFAIDGAEATDKLTGLVWRRCPEGQNWTGSTCAGSVALFTWHGALDRARSAASEGIPWRLPNAKELGSLVDDSRVNPAIDTAVFPVMPGALFWTSTHIAGNASGAVYVNFEYGPVYFGLRDVYNLAVRLVRSGQ